VAKVLRSLIALATVVVLTLRRRASTLFCTVPLRDAFFSFQKFLYEEAVA